MIDTYKFTQIVKEMIHHNFEESDDKKELVNLLKYYRTLNGVLVDMLETASQEEHNKFVPANLLRFYYTYVQAYQPLLKANKFGKDITKKDKEELLKLIEELENIDEADAIMDKFIGSKVIETKLTTNN